LFFAKCLNIKQFILAGICGTAEEFKSELWSGVVEARGTVG